MVCICDSVERTHKDASLSHAGETGMSDYCIFFYDQKTADELRISDWSSDVCSSDLDFHSCAPGGSAAPGNIPTFRHFHAHGGEGNQGRAGALRPVPGKKSDSAVRSRRGKTVLRVETRPISE